MSLYTLYAFLYDFAPKYIGGTKSYLIKNLPEPKAAFFIGGAPNDPYYQLTEGTIREIEEDKRLADLPLVRKNMQGINQVRSYAKQFNAKFSSVISKNKVWVFSAKDDFEESIFEASWAEMQGNIDVFSALVKILGKS